MINIPHNIQELSEKNNALLDSMNFVPGKDNPLQLCNPAAYRQTGLFSEDMITTMFSETPELALRSPRSISRDIGMILIRPDMMHATSEFEHYIGERFTIIHHDNVTMDRVSYWNMYQYDLYRPETMHSRLSRAALYIGSQCCLIAYKGRPTGSAVPTADYTRKVLKGSQGIYQPGTLRGDIVYRSALALQLHKLPLPDDDCRIKCAVDPFGAYQSLAIQPTGPHAGLEYPLLFYIGVGVHVPDSSEIDTDLPQLLPEALKLITELSNII